MPPQGYMAVPPGAPPGPGSMMQSGVGPMMPPMGTMPAHMMAQMPPNTSPAHLSSSQSSQGQLPGPQGQVPHQQGQMPGPQGQMPGPQGQMPGSQGQMPGPQGQMPGPQGQVPHQQGQMPVSHGQMHGPQGQMPGPQTQIPGPPHAPMAGPHGQPQNAQSHMMSQGPISLSSHTQIQNQGGIPNQSHNPAQSHIPLHQGQVPHQVTQIGSQHQMIPGAPMSPTNNAQMHHSMNNTIGPPTGHYQPPQTEPTKPQEYTAELISFD